MDYLSLLRMHACELAFETITMRVNSIKKFVLNEFNTEPLLQVTYTKIAKESHE